MRILMAVAALMAILGLVTPPAQAQGMGGGMGKGHRRQSSESSTGSKTNKADEKAYRDALKSIPEKKTDPWGNMR
jgi:hypothetical protein